ncbi:MAG: TIM barrel protein, partial [Prevotellaceae bacterium]|nr:TIM barrel protein [Prevotellaceae bacterium]
MEVRIMEGRLVTLMTDQWTDMDLETLCKKAREWGYDGLELACWGKHYDVGRAVTDDGYVSEVKGILDKYGMKVVALSTHIIGQCVCDDPDPRLNNFAPAELADKPEEIREWAIQMMKDSAVAARKLGATIITGFTGSPIWKYLYSFPQTTEEMVE